MLNVYIHAAAASAAIAISDSDIAAEAAPTEYRWIVVHLNGARKSGYSPDWVLLSGISAR
jgi:hypothetical protein